MANSKRLAFLPLLAREGWNVSNKLYSLLWVANSRAQTLYDFAQSKFSEADKCS